MKVVIQRSKHSSVSVDNKIVGQIDNGLVILVGFTYNDDIKNIEYIIDKIINLRIFDDDNNVMNKSLLDVGGSILSISQFTLYADTSKGRRPSYNKVLPSCKAEKLYDCFNNKLKEHNINVETGMFGKDMSVSITNDGPVTIIIESE
jgi:D-tyrosyl-tRNA(Tyr) deacylase